MEKINLSKCWEKKYVDNAKTYMEKSLNGSITHYYDKWGAFLMCIDTFGECDRLYSCELEYIDAIKHLITIERYEKLLRERDITNEVEYDSEFEIQQAIIEEKERR